MLVPTNTLVQRLGLVITITGLLGLLVGILNVAPAAGDFIRPTGNPPPTRKQGLEAAAQCDKEFKEQKPDSSGGIFSLDVEGNRAMYIAVCYTAKFPPQTEIYKPSLATYAGTYVNYVMSSILKPADNWPEQLLYWGSRTAGIGLFLLYLFNLTVGRLFRFIWHGRAHA